MAHESFPALLCRLRLARGWSQARLAEQLCEASGRPTVGRQEVSRWENGRRVPRFWLPHIATVLQVSRENLEYALAVRETDQDMHRRQLLALGPAMLAGAVGRITPDPLADLLRQQLFTRPLSRGPSRPRSIDVVEVDVRQAHNLYQRANYTAAAEILARLTPEAEWLSCGDRSSRRTHRTVAAAYLATSKLAAKLGDGELSWLAADRASTNAMHAEDTALHAVATGQAANALMKLPDRITDAESIVQTTYDQLMSCSLASGPDMLSARGALLLISSTIAGRLNQSAVANEHLNAAGEVAQKLGRDGNQLWTAFGPTNVLLHKVAVSVALCQPEAAIATAEHLDTSGLPSALVSRRAQVHLDLATAFCYSRDGDAPAVLHLLEAERIAPEVIRMNHRARALVTNLVHRERQAVTPGLRALALRAGVAR